MNYKRIGVVLIASASIILAGCGNSAKNMTFQETYNAFLDSHTNQVLDLLNGLSTAPALGDESTYAISGNMMSGAQIHLMIWSKSTVINSGMDTDTTMSVTGQLTQPESTDVISLDAGLLYKMVDNKSYINLSKLSVTSKENNPELSMVAAFSSILTNKWISISDMSGVSLLQPINLSSLYTLPSAIVASLKAHPIFVEKSKEMVDGNPVYHVALDETGLYLVAKDLVANDIIKAFLRDTVVTDEDLQNWAKAFVGSSSFDGVMTAYGKNNIALTINTLQLDSVESLQGTVGKNDTHFQITDSTVTSWVITFDINEKGTATSIAMNAPAQDIALQASVDMKQANANGVAYGLGLTFTHPEFTLRLDGDMKIHKTDAIVIKAPDAAVSLESLLGNFGGLMGGSGADAALSQ